MPNRQKRDPGTLLRHQAVASSGGAAPGFTVESGQAWKALQATGGQMANLFGEMADRAAARQGQADGLAAGAAGGRHYQQRRAIEVKAAARDAIAKPLRGSAQQMAATLLRQKEDFSAKAYNDPRLDENGKQRGENIYRAGFGSDTITRKDGTVEKVTENSVVSRADAERDLTRRIGEFQKTIRKQIGNEVFDGLPADIQAVVTSVGYNYGSLPRRTISAVKSGDRKRIADAIEGLAGDNGGVNEKRRKSEAAIVRSGKSQVDGEPPASFTIEAGPDIANETPWALRRDGTIYGDAFDKAAVTSMSWRMATGLKQDIAAAYEVNKDDRPAFQAELQEIRDRYLQDDTLSDPEMAEVFDRQFVAQSDAYLKSASTREEARTRAEERAAVSEGLAANADILEKQAFTLGGTIDGDVLLDQELQKAAVSIDQAVERGVITPAEAVRQRDDVAKRVMGGRIKGMYDALDDANAKRAFADQIVDDWSQGKGPLKDMPLSAVEAIAGPLQRDAVRQTAEEKQQARIQQAKAIAVLNDDLASTEATGQGVDLVSMGHSEETLSALLGADKLADWKTKKRRAELIYEATAGLDLDPPAEIRERLAALKPQKGQEGFATAEDVFDKATRKADALLRERAKDPVAAIEAASPDMVEMAAGTDQSEPQAMQALIAERHERQTSVGITGVSQNALNTTEVRQLAAPLLAVTDPQQQQSMVVQMVENLNETYGPHAPTVLRQVLQQRGMNRQAAQTAGAWLARITREDNPTKRETAAMDRATDTDAAEASFDAPTAPLQPNSAARSHLLNNPDLAAQFDEKYGAGQAAVYLKLQQQGKLGLDGLFIQPAEQRAPIIEGPFNPGAGNE